MTNLNEIWLIPLLLALALLVAWIVARRRKRNFPVACKANGIVQQASTFARSPGEFPGVFARSLSGMEDRDFQSLNPRSSKLAKLDSAIIPPTRLPPQDEESGEYADLDEDDDCDACVSQESADRSFLTHADHETVVVCPSPELPPEPALELPNDLPSPTLELDQCSPADAIANAGQQCRCDIPQPIKPDTLRSAIPARISRVVDVAIAAEPGVAVPKYTLAAHSVPKVSHVAALESRPENTLADELSAQLAAVTQQRDAALAEKSRLVAENEEIQLVAAAAETLSLQRQTELQTAQHKLAGLEQERIEWQKRLAEAQQRFKESDAAAAQLKQLTEYSSALSRRLSQLESAHAAAELRMVSLAEEATQAKSQAAHLRAERDSFQTRLTAATEQLQAEKDRRSELITSKIVLESSLAALHNQFSRVASERKKLRDDFAAANRLLEQARQKQAQLAEATQATALNATEVQTVRDEVERLRQKQEQLSGRIESMQSDKTRDQNDLAKLRALVASREQELAQSGSELATARAEVEWFGKQLAERRPVDSAEKTAELTEMKIRADKLAQVARLFESRVALLSQQIAEMEISGEQQRAQLSAADSLVSQLQVELQGAEDTARYLEIAREEALDSLENERLARRAAVDSLQCARQKLAEQQQQMGQLTAERQLIANQLQIVLRDQDVLVSERDRFQKELTQAELIAVQMRADCQVHLELVQQLREDNALLLLETNQQPAKVADGDDLTRIKGIGKVLAGKLREAGVNTFEQITNWDQQAIEDLTARLGLNGRIQRDGWVEQAARFVRESQTRENTTA